VTEISLDGRIVFIGILVTLAVGLLTSLLPLVALCHASIASLIGSGRGSVKGRSTLQGSVIVGQIALGVPRRGVHRRRADDAAYRDGGGRRVRRSSRGDGRRGTRAEPKSPVSIVGAR
jgi:hypothetical protein